MSTAVLSDEAARQPSPPPWEGWPRRRPNAGPSATRCRPWASTPIPPGSSAARRWPSCTRRTPGWSRTRGRARWRASPGVWCPCGVTASSGSSPSRTSSGTVQLMFQADHLPAGTAAVEALVDLGDWVGRHGRGDHQPERRALGRRDGPGDPVQGAAAAARQVARPERDRDPVPPARGGPAGQQGQPAGLRHPVQDRCPSCASGSRRRTSWRSRPPSCSRRQAGPWPARSSPTPMRWTPSSACASRRSSTSSGWWSEATSGCSKSPATSATRGSTPGTARSSPRSRRTAPSATSTTGWTSPST